MPNPVFDEAVTPSIRPRAFQKWTPCPQSVIRRFFTVTPESAALPWTLIPTLSVKSPPSRVWPPPSMTTFEHWTSIAIGTARFR